MFRFLNLPIFEKCNNILLPVDYAHLHNSIVNSPFISISGLVSAGITRFREKDPPRYAMIFIKSSG